MKLKSRRALLEFMDFQKLSGRALARKAGISPAIVGHLARDPKRYDGRVDGADPPHPLRRPGRSDPASLAQSVQIMSSQPGRNKQISPATSMTT